MDYQTHPFTSHDSASENSELDAREIQALRTQIVHLTRAIDDEKRARQSDYFHLTDQIKDLQNKITSPYFPPTRASITSSRASVTSRRNPKDQQKLNPEEGFPKEHQLIRCLSENRLSIHEPMTVQNSIKQDFSLMMKEFSQFKNQIKLEIASLHDNFSDIDLNVQECLRNIGNKGTIKVLISNVLDMEERTTTLLGFSEKTVSDLELIKDQIEYLNNKIAQTEDIIPQEINKILRTFASVRQEIDTSQIELSESLTIKLSKVIESYNLNFEDMDRSINQIKEVMVDVVKINKIIKEKIGVKLSNIIDNETFHKTIEGLNESLHETYMLSNQKIKEMHQRDYEVEHELHQMKDALHYLQSDFGYNYSRLRLNQSNNSDDSKPGDTLQDETSTFVSQNFPKFKKNKTSQNHVSQPFKKEGRFRTQNDDDSHESRDNSTSKKASLAQQLRQLQMQ